MKRFISITILLFSFFLLYNADALAVGSANVPPMPNTLNPQFSAGSPEGLFYDSLRPYGEWVWVQPNGWCWYPYNMPIDWRPYTNGYWAYTDYGWTWCSDEPWGGPVFIMELGILTSHTAGFGARGLSGHLRGLFGDAEATGLAGRLVRPGSDGTKAGALICEALTLTTLYRDMNSVLLISTTSAMNICATGFFRWNAMSVRFILPGLLST